MIIEILLDLSTKICFFSLLIILLGRIAMIRFLNFTKGDRYINYLFILLLLVLSGCVSTSKYQALQTEYDSIKEERNELQEVNQQMQTENDELNKKNIELASQATNQIEVSQSMISDLEEEIDTKATRINSLEEKIKTSLLDTIIFKSGSAKVTKEGRKILARIAPILKEAKDKEINIVGHCDKLPPGKELSKKYRTNWELSTARTTAIAQILQWGYGIDPDRMYAVGVAHYRPLDTESEKKISEKNRVVEIFLTTPKKAEE